MRWDLLLTLLLSLTLPLQLPTLAGADDTLVKLDEAGRELPDQATEWSMVLDRSNNLTWEVKSSDGSLHDKDNLYSWKSTQKTFIRGLNKEKFGGYSDWRMPEENELGRLQKLKNSEPDRYEKFFPRTIPTTYWTWSRCQDGSKNSVRLKFGDQPPEDKREHRIRAVRGELKE